MAGINKKGPAVAWIVSLIVLGLAGLSALIAYLIKDTNVTVANPQGAIAKDQYDLLIVTTIVLVLAAVPVVLFLYYIAWRYRESNTKAVHAPSTRHGKFFVFSIWAIPAAIVIILTPIMYLGTHRLEPRKTIAADQEPMTIQVISLRWKWLFLYPEQGIATVNFVQIPEDRPVTFELTADESPMSSLWIPNLGGQLYMMSGHVNRLNLIGDTPGDFPGRTAEITGSGFANMTFTARVSTQHDFDTWVSSIEQSSDWLDEAEYKKLLIPSEKMPARNYAGYEEDLYNLVIDKYRGAHQGHTTPTDHSNHEGHH